MCCYYYLLFPLPLLFSQGATNVTKWLSYLYPHTPWFDSTPSMPDFPDWIRPRILSSCGHFLAPPLFDPVIAFSRGTNAQRLFILARWFRNGPRSLSCGRGIDEQWEGGLAASWLNCSFRLKCSFHWRSPETRHRSLAFVYLVLHGGGAYTHYTC